MAKPVNLPDYSPCSCCPPIHAFSRRHFLRGLMASGLLAGFPSMDNSPVLKNLFQAQALVLSCIDFRFLNYQRSFLNEQNLDQAYDWVALAGASLALTGFPHPAEAETFWDQLALSKQLHNINRVIIFDHQDCGAYAKVHAQPFGDRQAEENFHAGYLHQAEAQIRERYPDLIVELYFVDLTGQVKVIASLA
ncbi:sll0732 [Synechocystis sp. PCC 6803]|uniref:Sll0732 protein n=1 Tax=Synechocystis sp. (strain ATCC 27184 / PCC 6803 / Kazusa) TaxID=1111708 RepID=P74634_SYNY3|nr:MULTISPECIES: carbonic anhydrase [unclassified Synechocystis]AGF53299.1 hypothetical protein MYO_130800 [Synechocystis sp. PCC 6803]ALJ69164.1 hypothetical protein AOY38_15790 [Synechocystis sp. PCC 6803]AVP91034.1 hypothetical protein C7I86_15955 [Synechocystis sp. IPPAS B-1465]MBD2618157.1 hypothetical protein [Synechocystis sp. FACHB-898]MBD2637555.1 hypothetical protein [Synechocystis sp. FACHB-908]